MHANFYVTTILVIALLICQLGNWFLSRTVIQLGTRKPGPAVTWIIARTGLEGFLVGREGLVGLIAAIALFTRFAPFVLVAICAVYGWLLWRNCRIIHIHFN